MSSPNPTPTEHTSLSPPSVSPKTCFGENTKGVDKSRSRLNAIKHGFYATDEVYVAALSREERASFWRLRLTLINDYKPQTAQEKLLVDRIAIQHFRLLRLYRLEHQTTNCHPGEGKLSESVVPHLDRFSRYEFQVNRQIRILQNRLNALYMLRRDYSLAMFLAKE